MMLGRGSGNGRHRLFPAAQPAAPPATPPLGFALNGSSNLALKAMVARVAGGTGRGRFVVKGDSTSAGAGGGTSADTLNLTDARPHRTSAVLAGLLSASGLPALDNGVVGDNGMTDATGFDPFAYDNRLSTVAPAWPVVNSAALAGSGFWAVNTGALRFRPVTAVDTFEIVFYTLAATCTITVDGAAPAAIGVSGGASVSGNVVTVPGTTSGFCKAVVTAASPGVRRLEIAGGAAAGAVRSILAYASGTPAIDIVNHAGNGATSSDQAAANPVQGWSNRESLAYDQPDLTIINLGLNDVATQVPVATYAANLGSLIDTARASGDVLLVFPHPAGGAFAVGATAYRDAAATVAASRGAAFLSLFDHFGGSFTPALQARMADGLVHGNAGFYAEVADLYRRCLAVMAA